MTLPLRRKRLITVRGRNTLTRTAASLLGLVLVLGGSVAQAQQTSSSVSPYGKWRQAAPAPSSASTSNAVPTITTAPQASAPAPVFPVALEPESLPEPIQRISAQIVPAPSIIGRATSSYSTEDLQAPIPLGLREGGPNPVVRLESEANFNRRIAQKVRQTPNTQTGLPDRAVFPDEPIVSREKYAPRPFPGTSLLVEPNYVCYGRLYFQERNSERYGWDLGIIQPLISTGMFLGDFMTLPYQWGANLCAGPECSAGQCLPGDPVPYMIYPPQLSLTGAVAETAAIAGLLAIFP